VGANPLTGVYSTAIPNYAHYGTAGLLAKTAYENTLAHINRNRSQSLHQFGYLGDVDPNTGALKNFRVDPNSMFGGFQSMLRNQAQQDQEAEWANQDRGLRGGLANKAYSALKYNHGAESAQFGTDIANQFTDYQDQLQQAAYDRDRALYEAQLEAARNAIGGGDFSPASYDPNYDPGPGGDPTNNSGTGTPGSSTFSSGSKTSAAKKKLLQDLMRGIRGKRIEGVF
jgi:hypothetical protein